MDRRELLRAFAAAAGTAAVAPRTLDWMADAGGMVGGMRVDRVLLDRLESVTSALAGHFHSARPDELIAPARGLTEHLTRLLGDGSMLPGMRSRLAGLAADSAMFSGWLALDADHRADASAFYALALGLAPEAHDDTLYALALGAQGLLRGLAGAAGRPGDPRQAVWQIKQAYAGLSDAAPAYARAYLAATLAKHAAVVGEEYGFCAGIENANAALSEGRAGQQRTGFLSGAGWFSTVVGQDNFVLDYEGRGLALLGSVEAEPVVRAALASDAHPLPKRHTGMLVSLGRAYVALGEHEAAAAVTREALDVAAGSGYSVAFAGVRSVRAALPDGPLTAQLDEALALR